jgi:hypothetical protein
MRRIVTALASGALGVLLLVPCARAQSWEDMQSDRAAIETGREHLGYDRHELREDLRRGDYAAAAREQAEMNARRRKLLERQQDLNNDQARRFYGNGFYGDQGWRHYGDDDDD